MSQPHLRIVLIHLREANAYVEERYRHLVPVVSYKCAVAVATEDDAVRGVAIVGRLVARRPDEGSAWRSTAWPPLDPDDAAGALQVEHAGPGRVVPDPRPLPILEHVLFTAIDLDPGRTIGQAEDRDVPLPLEPTDDVRLDGVHAWEDDARSGRRKWLDQTA